MERRRQRKPAYFSVRYFFEHKPMGGRRGSGGAAVFPGKQTSHIFHGTLAAPYLQQRSHQRAHHAVQEPIACNVETGVAVRLAEPARLVQGANTVFRFRLRKTERIEVVFAEEHICGGLHAREIRLRPDMDPHMPIQRTKPGGDVVAVAPEAGVVAGMKAVGRLGKISDCYGVGKQAVQGSEQATSIYPGFPGRGVGDKMRHLPPGMYPGVGASCSDDSRRGTQGGGERGFERALHRRPARLNLPSGKGRPVVFYGHAVYRHRMRAASADIVF